MILTCAGSRQEQLEEVRRHIREFKAANGVERVVVLWTANTERYSEVRELFESCLVRIAGLGCLPVPVAVSE